MRKKLKRKIAIPQVDQARDVLPDNLSREEMTQIIADAIVLAEEKREKKEQSEKEVYQKDAKEKWIRILGIRDYSEPKWYNYWLLPLFDAIKACIRFNRIRKEEISGTVAVEIIQKFIVGSVFYLLSLIVVLPSVYYGSRMIYSFVAVSNSIGSLLSNMIVFLALLIMSVTFRGFLRMAVFEVEELKDGNYLSNLFAAVISFLSVIVAVISVIIASKP